MLKRKKRKINPAHPHTQKIESNPYFKKDERSWFEREVWVLISIIVLLGVSTSYFLLYSPFAQIDEISISGNKHLSNTEIESIAQSYLDERILWAFPRSYLLIDTEELENRYHDQIANKFALRNVAIKKQLFQPLIITVEERVPGIAFQSGEDYFYLDELGFVTNQVKKDEINPDFSLIQDVNAKKVQVGEQIISETLLDAILQAEDTVPEKTGHQIAYFEIPPLVCKEMVTEAGIMDVPKPDQKEKEREIQERLALDEITVEESLELLEDLEEAEDADLPEREFTVRQTAQQISCNYVVALVDVTVVLENGPRLFFSLDQSITDGLVKMDTALSEAGKNLDDLSYIDLRFSDRVYLK